VTAQIVRLTIPGQTRYSGSPLRARRTRVDECLRLLEALDWGADTITLAHGPLIGDDASLLGTSVRDFLEELPITVLAGIMAALTGYAVRSGVA
jgi:hypothetical protein